MKLVLLFIVSSICVFAHMIRDDNKSIVIDIDRNLMWQDDEAVLENEKPYVTKENYKLKGYHNTSGDTASTYCTNLVLDNYTNWRLPTLKELLTIVDYTRYEPSINSIFKNTYPANYWTSTSNIHSPYYAWFVYFYSGYTNYYGKDNLSFVRCVRDIKKEDWSLK